MAYMSQEHKKELAPRIKGILKKYGVKGTLGVKHHSALVLTVRSGMIDFGDNHQVNEYRIADHWEGEARDFLLEIKDAMNIGNHDNSDIMIDHFDVGWYIEIRIGEWDKPYEFNPPVMGYKS